MEEVAAGVVEDTGVEFMVMAVVMAAVAEEDVAEGAMVITHVDFPKVREHSCQRPVYTL